MRVAVTHELNQDYLLDDPRPCKVERDQWHVSHTTCPTFLTSPTNSTCPYCVTPLIVPVLIVPSAMSLMPSALTLLMVSRFLNHYSYLSLLCHIFKITSSIFPYNACL